MEGASRLDTDAGLAPVSSLGVVPDDKSSVSPLVLLSKPQMPKPPEGLRSVKGDTTRMRAVRT